MKKLLLLSALFIFACTDDEGNPCIYQPTLTTEAVTNITETSATLNGTIDVTSENCEVPNNTEQGFVYSTEIQPTLEDTQVNVNGTNISTTIEGLTPNTTYYVRAFLTNNFGDFYGEEVSFTTVAGQIIINTLQITDISTNSAVSGGEILSDGNASILSRGVCWNTNSNPTIDDSYVNNNSDNTSYQCLIDGLLANTEYYIRAFATNEFGTYYGNELIFSTNPLDTNPPTITLLGSNPQEIYLGESYSEYGATAIDDIDGDITANIVIDSSELNDSIPGSYNVIYTVLDSSNNSTSEIRQVIVYENYSYCNQAPLYEIIENNELIGCDNLPVKRILYGSQEWTVENACHITYRDGTSIPQVSGNVAWANLTTGAWCYYDNDPTMPKLYNWYAVMGIYDEASLNNPSLRKEFAPEGWHVPSNNEWGTLVDYLISVGYNWPGDDPYSVDGGLVSDNTLAKAMASQSGWQNYWNHNGAAGQCCSNNCSGFNAKPIGHRTAVGNTNSGFGPPGFFAQYWSTTNMEYDDISGIDYAGMGFIAATQSQFLLSRSDKKHGNAVRLVRD